MKFLHLGFLLGFVVSSVWVSAATEDFAVRISGTSVFVTCPKMHPSDDKDIILKKDGKTLNRTNKETKEHEIQKYDEQNNGEYHCEVGSGAERKTYRLYLKAKVCESCVDMEFWTVAGIVVGDILITVGVVILVYFWAKGRKRSPGTGGAPGRRMKDTKERPPPVPNPDYEPIRKGQRDVYDGLKPAF